MLYMISGAGGSPVDPKATTTATKPSTAAVSAARTYTGAAVTTAQATPSNANEAILAIARDHFMRLGFKNVTMDDLASEIGISKKTVYVHFASKSAFFCRSAVMFMIPLLGVGLQLGLRTRAAAGCHWATLQTLEKTSWAQTKSPASAGPS